MLSQESINIVRQNIVGKLKYTEEKENVSTFCRLLLKSMLQVDEIDRANVYEVAIRFSQFLQKITSNMQPHCQTGNLVEEILNEFDAMKKRLE